MPKPTQGYPDWQRVQDFQGDALIDEATHSFDTRALHGIFYVGQFLGLNVVFNAQTNEQRLAVEWYLDEAAAKILGTYRIDVLQGLEANFSVSNLGPFMRIVTDEFAAGNGAHRLRVIPTNRPPGAVSMASNRALAEGTPVNVGAGSSNDNDFDDWYGGVANVYFRTLGQPGSLALRYRAAGIAGQTKFWEDILPANSEVSAMIMVPTRICQARVNNTGGAAADYEYSIMPNMEPR